MKPLIIHHGPCMDGAGAALAAYMKFGEDAEYRAAQYGDPPPTSDEVRGREVYIVDFSYPRADLERIHATIIKNVQIVGGQGTEDLGGKLVVLDHHKTAKADLEGLDFCTFDMNKSGAMLAWEHFHPGTKVPKLIQYIQDRDIWTWNLPDSHAVSAALSATGAGKDFRLLLPFMSEEVGEKRWETLLSDGKAMMFYETEQIARIAKHAEQVVIDGIVALAAVAPVLQSEVGNALAVEAAKRGLPAIGACYYRDGEKHVWRVSLRSVDTGSDSGPVVAPDVSAIAKNFKGGGHHKAASFECERLPWW